MPGLKPTTANQSAPPVASDNVTAGQDTERVMATTPSLHLLIDRKAIAV